MVHQLVDCLTHLLNRSYLDWIKFQNIIVSIQQNTLSLEYIWQESSTRHEYNDISGLNSDKWFWIVNRLIRLSIIKLIEFGLEQSQNTFISTGHRSLFPRIYLIHNQSAHDICDSTGFIGFLPSSSKITHSWKITLYLCLDLRRTQCCQLNFSIGQVFYSVSENKLLAKLLNSDSKIMF